MPLHRARMLILNKSDICLNLVPTASTYPPTYPSIHLAHVSTYPPTHLLTYPPTHQSTYIPTHPPINLPTHLSTYLPTHPPINHPTHPPIIIPTYLTMYLLTHPPTYYHPATSACWLTHWLHTPASLLVTFLTAYLCVCTVHHLIHIVQILVHVRWYWRQRQGKTLKGDFVLNTVCKIHFF